MARQIFTILFALWLATSSPNNSPKFGMGKYFGGMFKFPLRDYGKTAMCVDTRNSL